MPTHSRRTSSIASLITPTHSRYVSGQPVSVISSLASSKSGKSLRSRRKAAARTSLSRALPNFSSASPFPPIKGYKLCYEADGQLSVGTAGTCGTQQRWQLNGCHDIDITSSGHQPYGWDALKVAYQRYKVNGCMIEVEFYNLQTITACEIAYQLLNPSNFDEGMNGFDPDVIGERQMGEVITLQSVGSARRKVKFYAPFAKVCGLSKLQFKSDVDNYTADTGSNPATKIGFTMAIADPNGGSSGSCRYKIKFTQYVTMYQRDVMTQS